MRDMLETIFNNLPVMVTKSTRTWRSPTKTDPIKRQPKVELEQSLSESLTRMMVISPLSSDR